MNYLHHHHHQHPIYPRRFITFQGASAAKTFCFWEIMIDYIILYFRATTLFVHSFFFTNFRHLPSTSSMVERECVPVFYDSSEFFDNFPPFTMYIFSGLVREGVGVGVVLSLQWISPHLRRPSLYWDGALISKWIVETWQDDRYQNNNPSHDNWCAVIMV